MTLTILFAEQGFFVSGYCLVMSLCSGIQILEHFGSGWKQLAVYRLI